jgi:hypothetical protein
MLQLACCMAHRAVARWHTACCMLHVACTLWGTPFSRCRMRRQQPTRNHTQHDNIPHGTVSQPARRPSAAGSHVAGGRGTHQLDRGFRAHLPCPVYRARFHRLLPPIRFVAPDVFVYVATINTRTRAGHARTPARTHAHTHTHNTHTHTHTLTHSHTHTLTHSNTLM